MRRFAGSQCILASLGLLFASGADATRLIVGYGGPGGPAQRSLYEVNPITAEAVPIFGLPDRPAWSDLAARSDDPSHVYALSRIAGQAMENRVSRIDLASGDVTDLYSFLPADFGLPSNALFELSGIAFSPSAPPSVATLMVGVVILGSPLSISTMLFDLDLETGARSEARTLSGVDLYRRLAAAPDGTLFTITEMEPRRLGVIDRATSAVTEFGSCTAATCTIRSMDFDPESGQLLAIDVFGELEQVSPITGETLRDIGPTGLGYAGEPASAWGMAFVVPEPHTGALLTFGLGALAWRRRARSPLAS